MISEFCEAVHPIAVEFRWEARTLRCRQSITGYVILVTHTSVETLACYVSIGAPQGHKKASFVKSAQQGESEDKRETIM
jgi:hypothetical protein